MKYRLPTRHMAERIVLSFIFTYPDLRQKVLRYFDNINHEDFKHEKLAAEALLSAIREGFSSQVDIYHHLSKFDALNQGNLLADLLEWSMLISSHSEAIDYARWLAYEIANEHVLEEARKDGASDPGKLIQALKRAQAIKDSTTDPEPSIDKLRSALEKLTTPGELLVNNPMGYAMPSLEYLIRGAFHIVAARPGIGKTSLLIQLAILMAQRGQRVVVASYEMSFTDFVGRMLIQMDNDLTSGDIYFSPASAASRIYQQSASLESLLPNITFLDNPGNIDRLDNLINGVTSPDIVLVDYLQLIPASFDTKKAIREVQVGDISRKLKLMAMNKNCPFVVAAQLSRAGEDKPKLSHLRESGTIEQDADSVTFYYKDGEEVFADTQKNRRGSVAASPVRWNGEFMRFERNSGYF